MSRADAGPTATRATPNAAARFMALDLLGSAGTEFTPAGQRCHGVRTASVTEITGFRFVEARQASLGSGALAFSLRGAGAVNMRPWRGNRREKPRVAIRRAFQVGTDQFLIRLSSMADKDNNRTSVDRNNRLQQRLRLRQPRLLQLRHNMRDDVLCG
jgi:hypothetical protein